MRATVIEPATTVPLQAMTGVFFATFSALWLLVEPIFGLGLLPSFPYEAGWVGYALIVALSVASVFIFVPVYRKLKSSKKTFLTFRVISASDGAEHLVSSPSAMLVGDFTAGFLKYLSRGPAKDHVLALQRTHEPVLQIITASGSVNLPNGEALECAGISNGVRCQISAIPREAHVLFSRAAPSEP